MAGRWAVLLLLFAGASATAEDVWVPPVARPGPPTNPRSLRVTVDGVVVRIRPNVEAPRRGLLARGSLVPYMGESLGPGCDAWWYRVDPEGYACGELLEPSFDTPESVAQPVVPDGHLMPFPYGYARADGARVYLRAEDLAYDDWDHELDPGFGIALDEPGVVEGQRVWRTRRGRFIRASEIGVARPSDFAGVLLDERSASRYAWVFRRDAFVHSRPGRRGRVGAVEVLGRHAVVPVLEERQVRGRTYLRVRDAPDERWIDARDVRRMSEPTRPPEVGPDERWIDVDRGEQVLVALEGDRPVFATLVSTGRALRSTPEGVHRTWVKLATSHMDNFEDEDAEELYSLEDVPWVMYFSRGVAIHGTFWHDRFGERRSHGCVNVSVRDARWLYEWSLPSVRDGWSAVFPTERSPGTVVVVR